MAKFRKKKLIRINATHDKSNDTVFLSWVDVHSSGSFELTPEEAIAIGDVGKMAMASREEKNADG